MWRKLLSVEYLLEPIPGQPAQFRLFYFLLSVCAGFGLFLSASMRRKRHDPNLRRALTVEAGLTVMALSSVGFAFAGVPFLSMRILVFGSSWIALLYPILVWVRLRERVNLLGRHRRAWSGQMNVLQPQLPLYTSFLLVGVHFVGLAMLASYYGWPWWSPLLLLFSLLSPQLLFSLSAWRWRVHLEALAPIFLVYAVLAARLLLLIGAKLLRYPHFFLPSAWDTLWNVNWAVLIALPWSFFSQVYAILHHQRREQALLPGIAAVWLLLSFAWASYTYVHHHTHGVTGSDPYCYAQMAVDLVEHRVPVHRFPLAVRMEQLGVSPKAGVHVGYHLPFDASGRAATVWPVGQSVLLALGYWLAGEIGLYLTTPVLGLLSLVVLAALSWELLSSHSTSEKLWVSAVAVFLLATSYAQIERLVVPMADAAAQLFTSLTVLLWLCATRSPAIPRAGRAPRRGTLQSLQRLHSSQCRAWALLAGLSFGAAYCVRHTQLVLGASVLFLTWVRPARKRQKVEMLTLFGLAALLAVIPDLLYHQWVMGHWLRPESLELRHFSLAFVGRMAARMAGDLHSAREFLFVGPFLLYGVWRQWREDRVHFGLLSSWVILVLLIHLPYEALRLRDVLSIFPALCFWTGYGLVGLWRWLQNRQLWPGIPPFLRGFGYTFLIMALFLLRTRSTLGLPRASDFDAFGHLNAFQRAGFAQIGQDTQETALIGASLNSGSVELHSERMAFRPALWRPDEFYTFADDAISRGVPLYLLEDGLEMAAPVAAARQRYHLDLVSLYDIPFYHSGGGSTGGRIPLYRLQPKNKLEENIMMDEPRAPSHYTIRELPVSERPRERLQHHGAAALSNSELLAIILRTGVGGESVLDLAQRLLVTYRGLAGLARASFGELARERGIGVAKTAQMKAAFELGKRLLIASPEERPQVMSPADAANLLMPEMGLLEQEHLCTLLLDTKHHVLSSPTVYVGNVNTSVIRVAELFREAVRLNCAAMIVAHNHPSGDPTPSPDDVRVTEQIVQAGKLLDIEVLDHLIIGRQRYVSLKERGLGFA